VRVHGGYFDERGDVDPAKVKHAIEIVEAMNAEGVYTHFSIYFPLWLSGPGHKSGDVSWRQPAYNVRFYAPVSASGKRFTATLKPP
jgi:hypothetical protein